MKKQLESGDREISLLANAITWQKWLVHIAVQLSFTKQTEQIDNVSNQYVPQNNNQCQSSIPSIVDITPAHSLDIFQYFLPKWLWNQDSFSYEWTSNFPCDLKPSSWAKISKENWEIAIGFFKSLRWEIDDSLCVSYIELAYHFHFNHFTFSGIENTPSNISTLLRKVINQAIKLESNWPLVIGVQKPGCLSKGKTLPAGFLKGSRPCLCIHSLKHLAVRLLHGRQPGLVHWKSLF